MLGGSLVFMTAATLVQRHSSFAAVRIDAARSIISRGAAGAADELLRDAAHRRHPAATRRDAARARFLVQQGVGALSARCS
jgi:hypothetical protein